jgi:flagellar biosynthesis/type III secretory pathway protein FliH
VVVEPLIPALGRERNLDLCLCFPGQSGLHSYFQASQSNLVTVTPCLKKKKEEKEEAEVEEEEKEEEEEEEKKEEGKGKGKRGRRRRRRGRRRKKANLFCGERMANGWLTLRTLTLT